MKKILVVLSFSVLLVLGLTACSQVNASTPVRAAVVVPTLAPPVTDTPTAVPPTTAPTATLAPTATVGATHASRGSPLQAVPSATAAPSATPTIVNLTPFPHTVSGIVKDANGPVANAIVQLHGVQDQVRTDAKGAFQLFGLSGTTPITVTAWSDSYYIGYTVMIPAPRIGKAPARWRYPQAGVANRQRAVSLVHVQRRQGLGQLRAVPSRL